MIGKKDNHDIFNQYRQVLVEQVISNNVIEALLNRVKSANMDKQLKYDIIDYIKRCETSFPSSKSQHGEHDADAAGYASYPDAKPAIDQDDSEAVNEPDPKFAEELAKARKEQQEKYPEKEESEEYPDPTSFFGGGVKNLSELGPMKFEPRPREKTPEEKQKEEMERKEREAYWAEDKARREMEKQERIKNMPRKVVNYHPASEARRTGKGVHVMHNRKVTDPDYEQKKQESLRAISAAFSGPR